MDAKLLQFWKDSGFEPWMVDAMTPNVAMPSRPTIEKLIAAFVLIRFQGRDFADLAVTQYEGSAAGTIELSEKEIEDFRARHVYPLDIEVDDRGNKYTKTRIPGQPHPGVGSTTELVLWHLGLLDPREQGGVADVFRCVHQWSPHYEWEPGRTDANKSRDLASRGVVIHQGERDVYDWLRKRCLTGSPEQQAAHKKNLPYYLAAIMTAQNNATGMLKSRNEHSFATLILKLTDIMKLEQAEVIAKIWKVIDMYFWVQEGTDVKPDRTPEALLENLQLKHLFEADFAGRDFYPFSLAEYFLNLWKLGADEEYILTEAAEFKADWDVVKGARQAGREKAKEYEDEQGVLKEVEGELEVFANGKIVLVHTDDPFLTRAIQQKHPYIRVMIIRKSTGHVVVQARGVDLKTVYRSFAAVEPGMWYLYLETVVQNIGRSYRRIRATELTDEAIVAEVENLLAPPNGNRVAA